MDFIKNIIGRHKQKQDKQEPHQNQTMSVKHVEKSKERRTRHSSATTKSETTTKKVSRSELTKKRRRRQKPIDKSTKVKSSLEKVNEKGADKTEKTLEKTLEKTVEKSTDKVQPLSTTPALTDGSTSSSGPSASADTAEPCLGASRSLTDARMETFPEDGKNKADLVEEKTEKVMKGEEKKHVKRPKKRAKETIEMSTEFEDIAAPFRPAVADDDKKSKTKKKQVDQDEAAVLQAIEDPARMSKSDELELDCTLDSPPSSDVQDKAASPLEAPKAATHQD